LSCNERSAYTADVVHQQQGIGLEVVRTLAAASARAVADLSLTERESIRLASPVAAAKRTVKHD
jgi:NAD(P)-dependent dehydrogenase (short-subunit alcohol dehydrogenase family)